MTATCAALGIVPTHRAARQSPKWRPFALQVLLARPHGLRYPTPCALARADVAQLVEHNLAKVGVAGSNPVVRSIDHPPMAGTGRLSAPGSGFRLGERRRRTAHQRGDVAKWQGRGLQSLYPRFESGHRLHRSHEEPASDVAGRLFPFTWAWRATRPSGGTGGARRRSGRAPCPPRSPRGRRCSAACGRRPDSRGRSPRRPPRVRSGCGDG
jgi:hypothetical protein